MTARLSEVWVMEPMGWPEEQYVHGVYSSADAAVGAATAWIERTVLGARKVTTIERSDNEVVINADSGVGFRAARFLVDEDVPASSGGVTT